MSGSHLCHSNEKDYHYFKHKKSLSFTQQLDSLLDESEEKYGLRNANADPEDEGNKGDTLKKVDSSDEDAHLKLWKMAKRIQKRNESYRTVAKILRELQADKKKSKSGCDQFAAYKNLKSDKESTGSSYSTIEGKSSVESNAHKNSILKHKSYDTKVTQSSLNLALGGNKTEDKTSTSTKPSSVVVTKLKMANPMKNSNHDSLNMQNKVVATKFKTQDQNANGLKYRNTHEISSKVFEVFKLKMASQESLTNFNNVKRSTSDIENIDIDKSSFEENSFISLMAEWVDNSVAVVMKLLNLSKTETQKEEYLIGSIFGEPYISGIRTIRNLPKPTLT